MQNLQRESKTPYGNQRKITLSEAVPSGAGPSCSTPYGNQRKITGSAPSCRRSFCCVLNALRQSEENHSASVHGSGDAQIVLNALRQSEENHSPLFLCIGAKRHVLNALRQSEENHANPHSRPLLERSAQRLTAIRGKSQFLPGV